ncbi:12246_t:CDS:2 [Ambispora leptoticha]|uniref:12246_t:CDS:1 n=1 Tax=Ambispora leptoticha TaxID=144679 RepID=A0A9N8Z286_9GLOM|nr:12246_t:CDS:2 [Ambispora leptoticha]
MVDAQAWFKEKYENETNSKAIVIKAGTELQGELKIENYLNLEIISLPSTKGITKLTIISCPEIKVISVWGNEIKKIEGIELLTKLEELNISENQIEEIDVSNNNTLKVLYFRKNPNFKFTELSKGEWEEVAKQLNLDTTTSQNVKKLVEDEIVKINSNKKKLTDPNTGKKYQDLVDKKENGPVKSSDGKEIDQAALTNLIKLLNEAGINPTDPNAEQHAKELKNTHDAVQNSELSGEIIIEDYTNTKEIILVRLENRSLTKGKISKVTINNCQALERVVLGKNEITEIIFQGNFPNLTHLEVQDNQLRKIDLSKIPNLENLNIARNPINSQELEKAVEGLTKLKFVNLLDTTGLNLKNLVDEAVKTEADKYKGYINPNNPTDKGKLENAAKNAGFIDPKDGNALEKAANDQGKSPSDVKKVVDSKPATSGSGTGATLTSEQQQKLNNYSNLEKKIK